MVTNVPEGYKQTEVGLIPEDWDIASYGDNLSIISGLGFKKAEYKNNGVKLLRIDNVSYGNIMWESIAYLPQNYIEKYKGLIIEENDVLLALNRPITNGKLKIAIARKKDVPAILYQRVGKIIFINEAYDKKYAFHLLTKFIKKFVEQSAVGTDQPFISTTNLKQYKIPLPPQIEEQKAIAQALSDVDTAIAELDRLITKKRNIKQGTMQQLLTGKKRLPGFRGEWEVKKLGEVADFFDGKRIALKDSDRARMRGQYPYYGASGIIDYVNNYIFDDELILLGEDGENILSRNRKLAFKVSGKIWVNNHAHVLKPKPEVEINFLTEYLESLNYEQYNTGTAQPKINQKVCSSIPVLLPSFYEQKAIAQVLSDMDTEIEALEQKRNKYKAIKQGMLQELLTGRTRLI